MRSVFLRATSGLLLATALAAPPARADDDVFGVRKMFPTVQGGREWSADWERSRQIAPYEFDPFDPLVRNSSETLKIGEGLAIIPPGVTRLYVLTPRGPDGQYSAPQWKNVEVTVYARRGATTRDLDYQSFDVSVRSGERHDDKLPCDGTSYHCTVRFDGQCGFKKELWHTGGYTQLAPHPAPRPWHTLPEGEWIGVKVLCRNVAADRHVRLEMFLDRSERNDWQPVVEHTDCGGWHGAKPGCDRPTDDILNTARPAIYFRTDYATVHLKKFSIREIAPLP